MDHQNIYQNFKRNLDLWIEFKEVVKVLLEELSVATKSIERKIKLNVNDI